MMYQVRFINTASSTHELIGSGTIDCHEAKLLSMKTQLQTIGVELVYFITPADSGKE